MGQLFCTAPLGCTLCTGGTSQDTAGFQNSDSESDKNGIEMHRSVIFHQFQDSNYESVPPMLLSNTTVDEHCSAGRETNRNTLVTTLQGMGRSAVLLHAAQHGHKHCCK